MSTDATTKASLDLVEWKSLTKGSLRGFAAVRLRNGLTIHDIPVLTSNGKVWASLPSKPMIGKDGQPIIDAKTGKPKYQPILAWPDRATSDRFSEAVVAAIEAEHPGAVR